MTAVRNRSVLVTGATGFIGSALCDALSRGGAEVHALSRSGRGVDGAASTQACDAADYAALASVVARLRPDLVYHLAAHVTGSREPDVVLPTLHGKLVSTVNLLAATQGVADCRVVLAGSLEEPSDEADPVPGSPYAAATWASTAYGRMFHALYDRAVVTARIFMAYGPGDPNDRRLVPHVVQSLLRGEAPALSSGARPVDWIYIDDLVRGLVALGESDQIVDGSVDLGTGTLTTVRDVALEIVRQIDPGIVPRFGALPDRPHERVRAADLESTRARLDWTPRTALADGLRQTIGSYRRRLPA